MMLKETCLNICYSLHLVDTTVGQAKHA
uniref:Uncharacterized protein n=1 Tax=Anguilla anguilla TaxID=7936 RepID=A0A0E9PCM8_ANGAN